MKITVENLTKNDLTKVCRSCLSTINLRPLFDNTSKCDLLRNMLLNYTRLKLHVDDRLPKQICEQCSKKLIDFASFISNCNKINNAFLKLTSQISPEIINAKHKNIEIYENSKDPSLVTQAFKMWLNDLQPTSNNNNSLTKSHVTKNVSHCQTNELSPDKTNKDELEMLVYEIKEEELEDVALEKVDEENMLEFYSDLEIEAKDEINFEYIDVNSKEHEDFAESPFEINTDLSGEIYENVAKNDPKKPKKFNCRICNIYFESITDFLTHCVTHSDQKLSNHEQEVKKCSKKHTEKAFVKFMCNVCLRLFNRMKDLMRHKKKHGNKEHRCVICLQQFPNSSVLSKHAKTHLVFEMGNKSVDLTNTTKRKQMPIHVHSPKLSKNMGTVDLEMRDALEKNKATYFNTFLSYIKDPKDVRPALKNRVDVTAI